MSTNYLHSYTVVNPQPSVLYGCLFTVVLVLIAGILVCFWWRRRLYYCCRRKLPHAISVSSLGKITQHHLTNPNYYSSSPDNPFLKMLRDMEIPGESITFQETVGEGCFGKVYKGIYIQDSGIAVPVAVKVLKDNLSSEVESDFEREVEAMSTFDHENILKLLGVVLKEAEAVPWMVFEFMQYGDLGELLRNNSSYINQPPGGLSYRLTQADLVLFATQIARGMTYLSSQHFVHRDLATRNCLVGENLTVKISDFGMSRDIYTCDYYKIGGSRMLPVRWMAPESMMYGKFTLDSDVWSYGVVLWEIFTLGKQPYYGHSNEEVVKLVLQGILLSPPGECPYYIYDIMAGCWKTEPRDRLKFPDIYQILEYNIPSDSSQTLVQYLDVGSLVPVTVYKNPCSPRSLVPVTVYNSPCSPRSLVPVTVYNNPCSPRSLVPVTMYNNPSSPRLLVPVTVYNSPCFPRSLVPVKFTTIHVLLDRWFQLQCTTAHVLLDYWFQ
ncbi:tyrosine-protein kinase transmembrane receptor Ror-like [Limulus polyphemus]|uniref:Tyrosine-protein kinase transmembrane receptor Ror-like n=1 Tax=Limulus polyphemus TaxID=6850 RepID=A0ABM1BM54_LIMPO|nr:tyrosine-protein kinase transmembrane receptor Ror-like [Limulus polyphemus]